MELTSLIRTLVLVGRTGNGKSATGNTILGRRAFKSKASSSAVTSTCELQKTVLKDGQIINVIDTPGLFDISAGIELVGKEIVKCIDLAKDGIHAFLLVLSVRARFSKEEEAAIRSLKFLFGSKIINYMIVVFTGGDALEDDDETLDDYLSQESPQPLKDILNLCENRKVLFDNKTKDKSKRIAQVQELLALVNMVINQNDGKPYTNELFAEVQKGAMTLHELHNTKGEISKLEEQMKRFYEDQLKRITDMVEAKLRELEQKLVEEQAARRRVEEHAQEAQMKSNEEIHKLRESLEQSHKETAELPNQNENGGGCTIL